MGARALIGKRVADSPGARGALLAIALLAGQLLAAWGFALAMPLIGDDWQILAKVREAPFAALFGGHDLLWRWWRPWSRELHFWTLFRLFGASPIAFHAASLLLAMIALALAFTLLRRTAGPRTAALATAGWAALAAWSGALLWAAGVQELWMLVATLAFLHAFARRRPALALAALAVALLSKETAAVAPGLALAWALVVDRDRPRAALVRVLPALALVAVWLVIHPTLRDRLLAPARLGVILPEHTESPMRVALRTLATLFNLQYRPAPAAGSWRALLPALPAIAFAAALAGWATWSGGARAIRRTGASRTGATPAAPTSEPSPRPAMALGASWALIAWLPLGLPSIDWHPYYTLLGALGAWLALAAALASARWAAALLVVGVAVLEPMQADTPVWSFSASLFQRRQAYFIGRLEAELEAMHPRLPPHTRLYFARVPNSIGLGYTWFSPAFRVWYGDSTVSGGFWSSYQLRAPGAPPGPDLFLSYDSAAVRWIEIAPGDPRGAWRPHGREDLEQLGSLFARARDWPGAARVYGALWAALPESAGFAYDAGVAAEMAGDTAAAARAYSALRAAPGADSSQRAFARDFAARRRVERRGP